jgi:ribosomal protein S6--L-glutamate ligase
VKKRTIGMWLYQNGGGDLVQKKLIKKLKEREIEVVS